MLPPFMAKSNVLFKCRYVFCNDLFVGLLDSDGDAMPHLQLEFKCFLVDQRTGKHIPVSVQLTYHTCKCSFYLSYL